tara:strand:- start:845 stop:2704 length:1860 start_codon:yes stop_codon:yes gene_type:complete
MSVLQKLTEGIGSRNLKREGAALLEKWERTGLLEGVGSDQSREGMARLLENQASQLLKEASSMSTGDVEGFASVAFPIVRRVFGGLIANELVSVQPMSLPSGLIFFLDFTYSDQTTARLGIDQNDSVYGGGVTGSSIQTGVTDITEAGGGFYNMANAFSSPTGSIAEAAESAQTAVGSAEDNKVHDELVDAGAFTTAGGVSVGSLSEAQKAQLRFDSDLLNKSAGTVSHLVVKLTDANMDKINKDALPMCNLLESDDTPLYGISTSVVVRRLTHLGYYDSTGTSIVAGSKDNHISFYIYSEADSATHELGGASAFYFPMADSFVQGDAIGSVRGTTEWALEEAGVDPGVPTGGASSNDKNEIPEIDIRVESIAVTAVTKKLKAKWTPELGQDLNAYHNLDAEVELTQVLSEHIALEIDREILNDLVQGATAGKYFWSRSPGLFVNRTTGAELGASSAAPDFTGTVSEWYETLVETINDVSAQIHRKTLRGGANFLVTSPEVANILEFTSGFRASLTADADKGTVGAVNVGSLSKKWDVWVDPYFPRNVVLVGRKGGSFLESGYVYAPYVPLQVTPTIFGPEDFVPRKGVMTRYAKKMVRPDMYGLVVVRGLLGESGATS